MSTRERLRTVGLRQARTVSAQLGSEVRALRMAAGLGQAALANAAGVSREWIARLEHGRLRVLDLARLAVVFACLGHKLNPAAYPVGSGLRDAGQLRLLDRFNGRIGVQWRRVAEAAMPFAGDLRAWDEMLVGPVRIGVDAETRPGDLQAIERRMNLKMRDSGVQRMVLLVADTQRNRTFIRAHLPALRQTYPLDTRTVLASLSAGRDPGGNGLVIL